MSYSPGPTPSHGMPNKLSGNVQLIDIGGGNVGNFGRFLQDLGVVCKQVNDVTELTSGTPIVLSAVGSFESVMRVMKDQYYFDKLAELIKSGTPYLGIGTGMQILFTYSEESPGIPGMNLLQGEVVRFKKGKCPQIGTNKISPAPQFSALYPKEEFVYFTTSYFVKPFQAEIVSFNGNYMERFCAAIKFKNVTGFQFHPEKSKEAGVRLVSSWVREAMGS